MRVHEAGFIAHRHRTTARARPAAAGERQARLAPTSAHEDRPLRLILEPGFSTAAGYRDFQARRGDGRRGATSRGSSPSPPTAAWIGTTFTIRVPLTLAIVRGYRSPRTGRPIAPSTTSSSPESPSERDAGCGACLDLRGQPGSTRLRDVLPRVGGPSEENAGLEHGGQQIGLVVDSCSVRARR
jgi:chemotaxis protein histidine kinase CheA